MRRPKRSSLAKQLILLAALALFVGWMIARPPRIEIRIGGGGFTGGA